MFCCIVLLIIILSGIAVGGLCGYATSKTVIVATREPSKGKPDRQIGIDVYVVMKEARLIEKMIYQKDNEQLINNLMPILTKYWY